MFFTLFIANQSKCTNNITYWLYPVDRFLGSFASTLLSDSIVVALSMHNAHSMTFCSKSGSNTGKLNETDSKLVHFYNQFSVPLFSHYLLRSQRNLRSTLFDFQSTVSTNSDQKICLILLKRLLLICILILSLFSIL